MPLARIITRALEQSQELAAELRGRGYEVEIVLPSEIYKARADVEIQVEECTPDEALIRAGVLPDRNDMSVFIAPGAITGRQSSGRVATENLFPPAGERAVQKKWYEASPSENAVTEEQLKTELEPIQSSGFVLSNLASEIGGGDAVDSEPAPVSSNLISSFSAELASTPVSPVDGRSAKQNTSFLNPVHLQAPARIAKPGSRAHVVSEFDEVLGHPVVLVKKHSHRLRIRIPALAGIKIDAWKSRAFLVGLAAIVVAMALWVLRRAPAPTQLGVTPAAAASPTAPPQVQLPIPPKPKAKARAVRQEPSDATAADPEPKMSPQKQNDGIKRYSDLD